MSWPCTECAAQVHWQKCQACTEDLLRLKDLEIQRLKLNVTSQVKGFDKLHADYIRALSLLDDITGHIRSHDQTCIDDNGARDCLRDLRTESEIVRAHLHDLKKGQASPSEGDEP